MPDKEDIADDRLRLIFTCCQPALPPEANTARAELCRQLGRTAEARASYQQALALTQQEPERRFLEGRLANLPG